MITLFLLSACSVKEYHKSEAKIVLLKTPKIKFSDTGYLRYNGDALELELYSGGQPIKHIKMNHLICVDEGCMTKSSFNAEYLSSHYPDDLLLHVSQGEPIFKNTNLKTTDLGFEQKFKNDNYNIIYRVQSNEIYFKDRINHILIRFKTLLP
ncbi:MAG: hypothetical protein U9R50_02955 [Campylobacterota bacterium]|nr:hypothetical protein [Campylobacterota bacterium]